MTQSNPPAGADVLLGVNLDHVATVREARGTAYPDLRAAIRIAEDAGADGITLHLREDRRHIQDADIDAARACIRTRLNMEMAATEEMVDIALRVGPNTCCLVPEKREELTTEGGLNVRAQRDKIEAACKRLGETGIAVSLFIEPDIELMPMVRDIGAPIIELHTGRYADAPESAEEYDRLCAAAARASEIGLTVNAGHGLRRDNVRAVAQLPRMHELNIGHAIIADAVFMGLGDAVRRMKQAMRGAEQA